MQPIGKVVLMIAEHGRMIELMGGKTDLARVKIDVRQVQRIERVVLIICRSEIRTVTIDVMKFVNRCTVIIPAPISGRIIPITHAIVGIGRTDGQHGLP